MRRRGRVARRIAILYRTNAQSRVLEDCSCGQIGYQVDRRHVVLRARGDQGRDRVPAFVVNPQDAGAFERSSTRRSAGSGQTSLSRVLVARRHDGHAARGDRAAAGPRPRHRGAKALGRFVELHRAAARARRSRRVGRRDPAGDAERVRLPERARGRAHDRGAGTAREPRRARAVARSTTRPPRGAARSTVPRAGLAAGGRRQPRATTRARHADDAPHRQGTRVPDRLHHRDGGRRVPARAGDRRGRARGGAPARLRRHHARHARPDADLGTPPQRLRRQLVRRPLSLHRRDPARS